MLNPVKRASAAALKEGDKAKQETESPSEKQVDNDDEEDASELLSKHRRLPPIPTSKINPQHQQDQRLHDTKLYNPSVILASAELDKLQEQILEISQGLELIDNVSSSEEKISKKDEEKSNSLEDTQISQTTSTDMKYKEGWLYKLGGWRKTKWERRWFLYQNGLFFYTDTYRGTEQKGTMVVKQFEEVESIPEEEYPNKPNCFKIVGPTKTYYLYSDLPDQAAEWIGLLTFNMKKSKKKS